MAFRQATAPTLNPALARQRAVMLAALLIVSLLAWGWMVYQSRTGMAATEAGLDLTMGMGPWAFTLMWTVMMAGMMLPAAAPMILAFTAIQSRRRRGGRPYVPASVFMASYLLVWSLFGIVVLVLAQGGEFLAERFNWLIRYWPQIVGGLLVTAGLYQFSSLKQVCLRQCRTPVGFLLAHWRNGWWGAFIMGLQHGLYCAGCCWLLFVILVPLGVMNLAVMGAVTAVVFAERTLAAGPRLAAIAGIVLMIYGAVVSAYPAALPGL